MFTQWRADILGLQRVKISLNRVDWEFTLNLGLLQVFLFEIKE